MNKSKILAVAMVAATLAAHSAHAIIYTFENITDNAPVDIAGQLTVDVTQSGSQALFTFFNVGSVGSSIATIYFDGDDYLASISSIINGPGVLFATGGFTPPVLPGGAELTPDFSVSHGTDANNPKPTNGVNPGEQVGVLFNLDAGVSFDDVIAALDSSDLRVGLHVISIGEFSDGFVNTVPVPDAATSGAMMTIGLAMLAWARRKFAV